MSRLEPPELMSNLTCVIQNQRQKARRPRSQSDAPANRLPQYGAFPSAVEPMVSVFISINDVLRSLFNYGLIILAPSSRIRTTRSRTHGLCWATSS